MSKINPQTIYYPVQGVHSRRIVGGMGLYNTTLALDFANSGDPSLVQYLLKDSSISVSAPAISPYCLESGDDCVSYLVPGGLTTVFPWAFAANINGNASVYIIHDAPAYQIDFWDAPSGLDFNPSFCNTYGMYGGVLQLCIESYGSITGHLVSGQSRVINYIRDIFINRMTGYRACSSGVDLSSACESTANWDGIGNWTTMMAIYRRSATVVVDRATRNILQFSNLGPPSAQNISPIDLFITIDGAILQPRNKTTTDCTQVLPQYYTTESLVNIAGLYQYDQSSTAMTGFLRNILAIPLYEFNTLMWYSQSTLNISELNLPAENYVLGTYASSQVRNIPEMWTVWVYISIGCTILLIIMAAHGLAMRYEVPERSSFPLLDYQSLIEETDSPKKIDDIENHPNLHASEKDAKGQEFVGIRKMAVASNNEIFQREKWVYVRRSQTLDPVQ